MDSHQAKEILAAFRPGTSDAQDPFFTDALARVGQDPVLARWFEHQQSVNAALRTKFRETFVPADLPDRILAGRKTVQPRHRSWQFTWIGLATAAAALIVVSFSLWIFLRQPENFAAYRNKMATLVSGEYKMMLESNDQNAIRQFLAQNRGHPDYMSTPAMDKLPSEGCALIDWHHKRVSLICLDLGNDKDLFLFVIDHAALPDAPVESSPQFASVGAMATATWTHGDRTYLLAVKGDAEQLRKYL